MFVFFVCIKARTRFGGKFAVPMNRSIRELLLQLAEEAKKSKLLFLGTCVLRRFAIGCQATDVANADRMRIVSCAMRSYLGEGTAVVDRSIEINHFVVPDGSESTRFVPSRDVLYGEGLALRCGRAMDDDFRNGSHDEMNENVKRLDQILQTNTAAVFVDVDVAVSHNLDGVTA